MHSFTTFLLIFWFWFFLMCVFDNNNKLKGMSSIAAFSCETKAETIFYYLQSSFYFKTMYLYLLLSCNDAKTFALHVSTQEVLICVRLSGTNFSTLQLRAENTQRALKINQITISKHSESIIRKHPDDSQTASYCV